MQVISLDPATAFPDITCRSLNP